MSSTRIKPPTYLLIAVLLGLVFHFLLPILAVIPFPWTLFGIIPIIAGLAINISADQTFKKADTPVCPFEDPARLVTEGPYSFTRNPMYLGFVLLLTGVAVCQGSLTPFVIVPAFGLLMDRLFIRMEEGKMALGFGNAWQAYKSRVRRWL